MADKKRRELGLAQRMNSCISAPQEEILAALYDDNLQLFIDKINEDELDISHEYEEKEGSTLLHLCVSTGKNDFVREILRHPDVNPDLPHKTLQKTPLHIAVENGNCELVSLLLRVSDVNSKMGNGSTALHLAALRSGARWVNDEYERIGLQQSFLVNMKMLLSVPGVNIDCKNNIGITPLFFAIDKGTEEVARELIKKGACVSLEIDGETIEEKIEEKMPNVGQGLVLNRQDHDAIENKLFHVLYYEYNHDKFTEVWEEAESNNNVVNVNADNGTFTFLQYCADHGYDKLVKFLLNKGAAPNRTCKNYQIPPLVLAGHHGYYKVIQVFKDAALTSQNHVHFAAKDKIKLENILHKIVKGESRSSVNVELRDYDRSLNILMEDRPMFRKLILPAVNATDQMGNTPLHIAAQLGKDSVVRKLLRCEANIGVKNKRMETPITFISPAVLEEFLDECLQEYGLVTDDNFQIIFKYSFLGPPLSQWQATKPTGGDEPTETDALEFKLHDEDDDDLEGDVTMIGDLPEAEPLWYMSQSLHHRPLLAHPVITSFLCLKWRRIRSYYYTNLAIYLLFVSCLTANLLVTFHHGSENTGLRITTLVLAIALTLREGFQALVSPRRYFFNLENILEIVMLGISIHLVQAQPEPSQHNLNLAAAAILLSWAEMFLMFGRHPKMSTFIKMFSSVSLKFMMFLMWYISLIVAFGIAFFFILHKGDNEHFKDPEKSMMKTVVMSLTGEIEFEGIKFGNELSLYGKIVFLLYIFFIFLVLVNLLNGLAVSDITLIQKEAEILSYVSRVELIAFIESMLLGDPFHFLTNWPPFAWGRKLPPCDCFRSIYRFGPVRWLLSKIMGTTLLFSDRLKYKKAVFLPNKSKLEQSNLPGPDDGNRDQSRSPGGNLLLDDEIIETAKSLLQKREKDPSIGALAAKLKQIEKSLLLMNDQQNLIIEMMNNLSTTK